jgi:hypothetical protein
MAPSGSPHTLLSAQKSSEMSSNFLTFVRVTDHNVILGFALGNQVKRQAQKAALP